jgi:hypothetical protein
MFGNLLSGLIDKEQITHDTIQSTLENIAEELKCDYKEFFIMIKPSDETFTMRFWVYRIEQQGPKLVREITLKEILNPDDE